MRRIKKDAFAGALFGAMVGLGGVIMLQKMMEAKGYPAGTYGAIYKAKHNIDLHEFILDLRIATIELKEYLIDEREGKRKESKA